MAWEKESEQELFDVDSHEELSIGEHYEAKRCVNYELSRAVYVYTDGSVVRDFDWEGLTLTIGQRWGNHAEVNFDIDELEEFAEFINRFAKEARKFKELFEESKPSNWDQL